MMKQSERSEFDKLASIACERALRPEEQSRLESLLANYEEARRNWLDYCRLHVELGLHNRAQVITQRVQNEIVNSSAKQKVSTEFPTLAECRDISPVPESAPYQKRGTSVTIAGSLIAVATLAVAASLLFIFNTPELEPPVHSEIATNAPAQHRLPKRRPEVVAVLQDSLANASVDGSSRRLERVILAGEELELLESAQLEMTGGASIFVNSPARIKFESSDHVRLLSGSLSAQLSEWAKGFVVDTNAMRLIDLGTAFAVTAESSTVAEVQVLQGLVRVRPKQHGDADLSGFLLGEGEAVRVDGLKATRNHVDLDSDAIRNRIEELSQLDAYQAIPTRNTGIDLQEGEEDPSWRITRVASEADVSIPRYAVVCEPHFRYSINEPSRSQWVSVWRGNDRLPADSTYTFQTSIDLTGYDERSVRLIGQVLADNGVSQIRLNGEPVDIEGWIDNVHRQEFRREEFHVIEIESGFQPGVNVIEFDVWNGGEFRKGKVLELENAPNPMALRVEWQAFGRPISRL